MFFFCELWRRKSVSVLSWTYDRIVWHFRFDEVWYLFLNTYSNSWKDLFQSCLISFCLKVDSRHTSAFHHFDTTDFSKFLSGQTSLPLTSRLGSIIRLTDIKLWTVKMTCNFSLQTNPSRTDTRPGDLDDVPVLTNERTKARKRGWSPE